MAAPKITAAAADTARFVFQSMRSFRSQIPARVQATAIYRARPMNSSHTGRMAISGAPSSSCTNCTASRPQKASQQPLCSIFRSFCSCISSS